MATLIENERKPFNHCLEKLLFVSSKNKSGLHFIRKEIYSVTTKDQADPTIQQQAPRPYRIVNPPRNPHKRARQ
jgi:hypothetical protein